MTIRHIECRVLRAAQSVPAATGGAALRLCAGTPAWQDAGNGMYDGSGRDPKARSAMR